jgi:HD-like signal output (HDOD) protein
MLGKTRSVESSPEVLRQFTPLDEATPEQLKEIAAQAEWLQAGKKAVLMELGDTDEHSIFLLKGNILLEAADGRKRIIKHTDPAARSPLSRLRPSRYRVTALTPVRYVKIDNAVLDRLLAEEEASEMISSHYYVVEEGVDSGDDTDFATQVLAQIYEDLHQDRLLIFSWQPAALPVTAQLLKRQGDVTAQAELAMLEPVLALKLLRKAGHRANGELPDRVDEAIEALGEEATRRLAFLNLFRESCRPHLKFMNGVFRNSWEQAVTVSALARELAREQGLAPVESVALAGLLHNIGKLTLLSYAHNFYREVSLDELKSCVQMFAKETGRMVLTHWGLPNSLVRGITDSFEWSKEHGGNQATLGDVLIAARLYVRYTRKKKPLKEVPALRKLGLEDPRSSRGQALQKLVAQTITEAREQLQLQKRKTPLATEPARAAAPGG